MYYFTQYDSPIGRLTLGCKEQKLVGLWIEGQKYFGSTVPEERIPGDGLPVFRQTKEWLDRYFAGEKPSPFELPLAPAGGQFRQEVWEILCGIPYGEVMTYGAIAQRIAKRQNRKTMSGQAVGGAVGHNPISIIIPCHRVVGARGNLTGYAGGVAKKRWLLAHEGLDANRFFIPKRGTAL
ncbi:MAG: methylated-DNA--[protein]-cysteine S-methyltransferase [Provencibacterium sp.]|jgi:methylated-DNA-[protein]-cysteine S-methyltransferase|nr:methylated-DNA--[protein]-cysteine S-methyltransferase [Provencibacterium sp.]